MCFINGFMTESLTFIDFNACLHHNEVIIKKLLRRKKPKICHCLHRCSIAPEVLTYTECGAPEMW